MKITIGTRGSKLALWQADHVAALLQKAGADTEIITISTKGDRILDVAIAKIGSKGVFTAEIEQALAAGKIDIAVHSAKDMPSGLPAGFSLTAFTRREKANDVVLSHRKDIHWGKNGDQLRLGTSSTRRVAMLKCYYPHINVVDIRGNLQTRIKKMEDGHCDALLLAYAGVHRMNYDELIIKELSLSEFVPAVGQGSIAIEIHKRLSDEKRHFVEKAVNDKSTALRIMVERNFLKKLQGGCSIPAFAIAEHLDNKISLTAGIISLDGKTLIKKQMQDNQENALNLGLKMGEYILSNGGEEILNDIRVQH